MFETKTLLHISVFMLSDVTVAADSIPIKLLIKLNLEHFFKTKVK